MSRVEQTDARSEHQFHHYRGNRIPWFVRLMWVCFWCFVAYYVAVYLVPSLRIELINPP
jgi:hypothetical protein